jgi:hypothetical protein
VIGAGRWLFGLRVFRLILVGVLVLVIRVLSEEG